MQSYYHELPAIVEKMEDLTLPLQPLASGVGSSIKQVQEGYLVVVVPRSHNSIRSTQMKTKQKGAQKVQRRIVSHRNHHAKPPYQTHIPVLRITSRYPQKPVPTTFTTKSLRIPIQISLIIYIPAFVNDPQEIRTEIHHNLNS